MIKYYGTPLSPIKIFDEAMTGRDVLIPFPRPDDLIRALDQCNGIIVDNGAFTIWRKGGVIEWSDYYRWIEEHVYRIDFFIIPDVINGTEQENDRLIADYRYKEYYNKEISKGVPVWHINESLERLERLMVSFDYIAFGSAKEYQEIGTSMWHNRLDQAMRVVCDEDGVPKVKIHMLRCLDSKIFLQYPFHSGDSTSLAQNHKRDGWRAIVSRVERYDSPKTYTFKNYYKQETLF